MAVLLHSPEDLNEKFLIKLRDCVVKLPDQHPLKRWMKWIGTPISLTKTEQERRSFLREIINSRFNLITDQKVKNKIINILHEVPENTISEKILKSYLYLMVGNVSRSDNILREIVNTPPSINWRKTTPGEDLYHKLGLENYEQIFQKLGRHPADRKSFQLLILYLQNFFNESSLLNAADEISTKEVEDKLGLKYMESLAPAFVRFLKIKGMNEAGRISSLRDTEKYPLSEQSYWVWPFLNIDPLVSEAILPELQRLEKEDELWFIYLLQNEKLADLYSTKSGKTFLPGRRPFLKENLNSPQSSFMMSLYKLIEMGDINNALIQETAGELLGE